MSLDRKKTGVAFWAIVALVVVVLYVVSFGPAVWLTAHHQNRFTVPTFEFVYQPILLLCADGPWTIAQAIRWYASFGTDGLFLVKTADAFLFL